MPDQIQSPATPFECRGLREDNPRDFLSSLGLLRLLSLVCGEHGVALSWSHEGHPVFHSAVALPDSWPSLLCGEIQRFNSESPHPFFHNKVIKVSLEKFRNALIGAVQRASRPGCLSGLAAMLYAAFASQTHDADKKETAVSSFSFSNGQGGKELLRDIREMIEKEFSPESLTQLLLGRGEGRRDAKSFRWNPAEFRAAAYRAADPGAGVKGDLTLDYPAANILAFFGLTFYPVVDSTSTWETCGFSTQRNGSTREEWFSWPTWEVPLAPDALQGLLHLAGLHADRVEVAALRSAGCSRVWRSRRFNSDKSLYFAPSLRAC